jgi:HAD superfamily hydrolase (TIGR01509 family)
MRCNLSHSQDFEAIIFDHDGTLLDTESQDYRACQLLFAEYGVALNLAEWAELVVGRIGGYHGLFDRLVAAHGNGLTREAVWERFRALWQANLVDVRLMPGVERLLTELHQAGYPLGVATASDRAWTTRWLGQFNLSHYFRVVATRDDVAAPKPAPDVYTLAAAKLGVRPERCLVFEDSLAGVESARAAGMRVVAVPNTVTRTLDFSLADVVIDGLAEVSLATLGEWRTGLFG